MDNFVASMAFVSLVISIFALAYTWLNHQATHVPVIETWLEPSFNDHPLGRDLRVRRGTDLAIHLHNPKPEIPLRDVKMEVAVYVPRRIPFLKRRLVIQQHEERLVEGDHYHWDLKRNEFNPAYLERIRMTLEYFLSTTNTKLLEPISNSEIQHIAYDVCLDTPLTLQCVTTYKSAVYGARRRRSVHTYRVKPLWVTDKTYPDRQLLISWKDEIGNLYNKYQ